MKEQLLKAIIRLFAIIAKERVTQAERTNIRNFILEEVDEENVNEYLAIFDRYSTGITARKAQLTTTVVEDGGMDDETQEFVIDWATIMETCKMINQELADYEKIYLILKVVDLVLVDGEISERQHNLWFYIAKALKVDNNDVKLLINLARGFDISDYNHKNYLVIDDSEGDYGECKHFVVPQMSGYICVLYLENVESYLIKYLGINPLRLNGSPLKSRNIVVFPPGSNIRGDKIETIYYSEISNFFTKQSEERILTLNASDVGYTFPGGRQGLSGIRICERSGKLIAIMGSSGSGKSTLLNTLSGKLKPNKGTVTINGFDVYEEHAKVEGAIGLVPQDDLLVEELTVYENMYFAARLSLGNVSEQELLFTVNKTLISLGLHEIKDNKVGSVLSKTISGGQRKRLNIGLELLREPNILFIDEPTSGLSSNDSENIMDLLKQLALKGKMVFVIIHQPSSDIFKLFDSLVILDQGGYQIYYGDPVSAINYFMESVNMISRNEGACITCGNVKTEQIFSIIESRVVNEYGRFTDRRKVNPQQWNELFNKRIKVPQLSNPKEIEENQYKVPNPFQQFIIYLQRDALAKFSNNQYVLINILQAPLLAGLLTFFVKYYGRDYDYTFFENVNIPAFFFMSIITAIFLGLMTSAPEIIKDRRIMVRESFLQLSKGAYLSSKVTIMFAISAFQMFTIVLISYLTLEIKGMLIHYWFALFTAACLSNLIGLLLSSILNSVTTAYIVIPLVIIPQLIFSGVVFRFDQLNYKIGSEDRVPFLGEAMASRWSYEAILVDQFKNNKYDALFYDIDKNRAHAEYKSNYYIPELLSIVEKYNSQSLEFVRLSASDRDILVNELSKELAIFGADKLSIFPSLEDGIITKSELKETKEFLATLKRVYTRRYNQYVDERNQKLQYLESKMGYDGLQNIKFTYANDRIKDFLLDNLKTERIISGEGRLIRKVYPIYFDGRSGSGLFSFRAHFFAPTKHFMGYQIDTFWFNNALLWFFNLVIFGILYVNVITFAIKYSRICWSFIRNKLRRLQSIKKGR